jgi:hypothetical protein
MVRRPIPRRENDSGGEKSGYTKGKRRMQKTAGNEIYFDKSIYTEAGGIFLCDPEALQQEDPDIKKGQDLLKRYTTDTAGDRVVAAGALLPMVVNEPDDWRIRIYSGNAASILSDRQGDSSPWSFHAMGMSQLVGGLGYLTRWDPKTPALQSFAIPGGWYQLTAAWGFDSAGVPTVDIKLTSTKKKFICRQSPPLKIRIT